MSTIIMSACWPLQGMSVTQKAVLISLADNANDEGYCWPSVKHIARRTCLSERSVQNAIKWLQAASLVNVKERNGRSNVYVLTPAEYSPPQDIRPAKSANTPADYDITPERSAEAPANPAPITINNHQGTVIEPSKEKKEKLELPDWVPVEEWNEYLKMRKEIRKPATEYAQKKIIGKLAKLAEQGHSPKAVLDQSTVNSWQGVFPIKQGNSTGAVRTNRHINLEGHNYEGTPDNEIDWIN